MEGFGYIQVIDVFTQGIKCERFRLILCVAQMLVITYTGLLKKKDIFLNGNKPKISLQKFKYFYGYTQRMGR